MSITEQTLLLRAAGGNRRALRRLYEAHVDAVHAFIYHRVGCNPALAEDAVQDTFLRALADAPSFDPQRGGLRGWLCETSRNVIRRYLRHDQRALAIDTRDDQVVQALARALEEEDAPAADELLARHEARRAVAATLDRMPEAYRTLLEMKYVLDLSVEELAKRRGVSVEALKSQLARARRAFREAFSITTPDVAEVNDAG